MKRDDQKKFSSDLVYYGFMGLLITLLIIIISN